jgi:multiple sugar transport system substrate-binding protein
MRKITVKQSVIACSLVSMLSLTACSSNTTTTTSTDAGSTTTPASGNKTVTLSVMTSDRFLELAKQKYEAAHPDTKINIKEYAAAPQTATGQGQGQGQQMMIMQKPDPKNTEKYASSVGAELMSGKASDIIVTSGLPYQKYADKKLLENMSDLMSKDASFKKNNYYEGIFDAMKYNGSLYTVPIKVGLNMWIGNQAVLSDQQIDDSKWTWADFMKKASALVTDKNNDGKPDTYPLGKIEPAELMTSMLNSSFTKFADVGGKKAKFDSPDFINMLKLAKSMYDDKLILADNSDPNNVVFQPKGNVLMYMDMYTMPKMNFEGKGGYYNLPSESEAKGTQFTSSLPLAINSKSANKKEAWEFVKYLLSDEMQSARELSGIAVNKNGAKAQIDILKTLGTGGEGAGKSMKLMINGKAMAVQPATEQDVAAMEKVLSNISVYGESDLKITNIVTEETAPFFQGQKSAEEVAKVIQNKVSTYLQE